MSRVTIKDKTFDISIPESEILKRVKAVADKINRDMAGKNPLLLAVLNGSFIFAADLMRMLTIPCEISFVKLASYQGTTSTGKIKEVVGINEDLTGRTIIIVEDIVESGLTMKHMIESLGTRNPESIHICTLLLKPEKLEIRKHELEEQQFFASLERIFIEERIYKGKPFENAPNMDAACAYVDERLTPYYPQFIREVRKEDILRLMEIKMQRILKFNKDKADELIARIEAEIENIKKDLQEMTRVTIEWFTFIKDKYGKEHPRRTELRSFDTIVAAKVAEANEKLYIDRKEGFIGTGLKKAEFVENCSDIDDIILFYKDGKYKVVRVQDKVFVGKGVIHCQVFKKNDTRTIYNVCYRDGQKGATFIKRFNVTSITRDKDYDLTQGTAGSRITYFTANPNGEAEIIKVTLEPNPKLRKIFLEKDFSEISIKGRSAKGYLLSRLPIHRISLKSHGHSTLGGRKVWFDPDVNRINYEEHGRYIGEFADQDQILVILNTAEYYLTSFDASNHYDGNIMRIEKFNDKKVWTAILYDADNQGYPYMKRFTIEASKKRQNLLGENPNSQLILLTDTRHPKFQVTFGGVDEGRPALEIDAEEFVGVKGWKAKGKRVTQWQLAAIEEQEPAPEEQELTEDLEDTENSETPDNSAPIENLDPDAGKSEQQVIDEITGQLNLFYGIEE